MRHLRLLLPALALAVAGTWSAHAVACDKDKSAKTSATSASAACTAEMAAKCTPEMAAACRAKGTKVSAHQAAKSGQTCSFKGVRGAAVSSKSKTTAYDHCGAKGARTSAVTASAEDHCGSKGARVSAAYAVTGSKGKVDAIAAGSSCGSHGAAMAKNRHSNCDACADMAICYDEVAASGVRTQVVPLKNGVMFVYTADQPGQATVVQTSMARRTERLAQIVTSGDRARLCPECKALRGAMASGKLSREVVNIEGGALTLMTSSDAAVVAKIHALVEQHKGAHTKS